MAKKKTKSSKKKKHSKASKKTSFSIKKQHLVVGVVAITFIIIGIVLLNRTPMSDTAPINDNMNDDLNSHDTIVATVNGDQVTQSDVNTMKTVILQQTGQQATDQVARDQIIAEILLSQEASRRGIVVSNQEAEELLSGAIQQQGSTLEQFKLNAGTNYDYILEQQKKRIMYDRLLNSLGEVNITDEQARSFFEANEEQITQGQNITYEQVEGEVKGYLTNQAMQQVLQQLVQELRSQADIKVQ